MTRTNIIERKKQLIELKKNRLNQMEAHLKIAERKARTRRLIELGGLVSKAGLDSVDANILLGALHDIKQKLLDVKIREIWAYKGGTVFSRRRSNKKRNSSC